MKKGFTLIEMLGVIIIITIILLVAVPLILTMIDESNQDTFTQNEILMERSIQPFLSNRYFLMPTETNSSVFITLAQMKEKKVLKEILDPKDKTECDENSSGVKVRKNSDGKYSLNAYLICNNFKSEYQNEVVEMTHNYNAGNTSATISIELNDNIREVKTPTTTIGVLRPSILDYTTWNLGTNGSQPGFSINGTVAENQIVLKENPWGETDVVWATLENDIESNADGGWNSSQFNIENNQTYRFSVWVRRENVGTGSGQTYLGNRGYNSAGTSIGVSTLAGTTNSNFYFGSALYTTWPQIVNNWLLMVAYVHPYDYDSASSHPTTGIYNITGTKLYDLNDSKWLENNARALHRTYLYYSTKIDERHYWYRPRVDLIDGSEPTVNELILGMENPNINDYSNINKTGLVEYTVNANGEYRFDLKIKDGSTYSFTYKVDGIN